MVGGWSSDDVKCVSIPVEYSNAVMVLDKIEKSMVAGVHSYDVFITIDSYRLQYLDNTFEIKI